MNNILQILMLAIVVLGQSSRLSAQFSYTEMAKSMGIEDQSFGSFYGGSVAVADFNQDGWDDITLGGGQMDSIAFYQNMGGSGFQRIYLTPIAVEETKQILWIDYDNDGDLDLFLANHYEHNKLYRNDGNLNLVDVTLAANIPQLNDPTWVVAWGDYDRDGFLDAIVTNYSFGGFQAYYDYMLHNQGDGTFIMRRADIGIPNYIHSPLGVVFMDHNKDSWPDIFIGSDKAQTNLLWENNGYAHFNDISQTANVDQVIDAMCVAVGDYDGNHYLDVYLTNTAYASPDGSVLVQNNGNSTFTEVSTAAGVDFNGEGWGSSFIDFDHDMDMDLYVSGAFGGTGVNLYNSAAMFDNQGSGTFIELTSGIGMDADTMRSYSHAIGDFDQNGFADIIVNNRYPDSTQLWMHNGGSNNWINVNLLGTASNRDAVGSWIELYVNGQMQVRYTHAGLGFMGQNTTDGLFGLGANVLVDSIKILWPSGHSDQLYNIAVNQKILIEEGSTAPVQPIICAEKFPSICTHQQIRLYAAGQFSQYSWSNSDTTHSIWVGPGKYQLTVVDAFGQIAVTDSFEVHELSTPEVDILESISLDCPGDSSGALKAIATQGTAPFSYQWSNGEVDVNIDNLAAGNYWVAMVDSFGCIDSCSFEIQAVDSIYFNLGIQPVVCQGDSNASILISSTGGTAPYTYLWDNIVGSSLLNQLSAGIYQLEIIDSLGCKQDTAIILFDPPLLEANVQIDLDSFAGAGLMSTTTGGQAPYTYLWSTNESDSVIFVSSAGTYGLEVWDDLGCYDSLEITVNLSLSLYPSESDGLLLFPNPTKGLIEINGNELLSAERLRVFNSLGQEILGQALFPSDRHQLDLSFYPRGIYWLVVEGKKELWSIKIFLK